MIAVSAMVHFLTDAELSGIEIIRVKPNSSGGSRTIYA